MALYFFFVMMMSLSFQGLFGYVTGKFTFASSRSTAPKKYVGKDAKVWGLLFFAGFAILPMLFAFGEISTSPNLFVSEIKYLFLTLISLLVAYFFRNYGIYKTT